MLSGYIFLSGSLIFTSIGHISLRYIEKYNTDRHFLIIPIFSFILVPYFTYESLRVFTLDIVYLSTSLVIVLTMIGSYTLLNEVIRKNHLIGALFIISGIMLYNL